MELYVWVWKIWDWREEKNMYLIFLYVSSMYIQPCHILWKKNQPEFV